MIPFVGGPPVLFELPPRLIAMPDGEEPAEVPGPWRPATVIAVLTDERDGFPVVELDLVVTLHPGDTEDHEYAQVLKAAGVIPHGPLCAFVARATEPSWSCPAFERFAEESEFSEVYAEGDLTEPQTYADMCSLVSPEFLAAGGRLPTEEEYLAAKADLERAVSKAAAASEPLGSTAE